MADYDLVIEVVTERSMTARLHAEPRLCTCVPDENATKIVSSLSECLDAGHPRGDLWFELFGKNLGTRLFQEELSDVLQEAFLHVKASKGRVRVLISFGAEASELAKLPWEFAQYRSKYLGVRDDLTLARLHPAEIFRPPVAAVFRTLIVEGGPNLGADDLEVALKELGVTVTRWPAKDYFAKKNTAHTANTYDVIHFIGHGIASGKSTGLLFQIDGDSRRVEPAESFALFTHQRASVVILQACSSAKGDTVALPPHSLLAKGVPAVIAMQYPILASHGNEFATTLYSHLVGKKTVDVAVQHAREALFALRVSHGPTFGIPVLYLASTEPISIEPIATLKATPTSQQNEGEVSQQTTRTEQVEVQVSPIGKPLLPRSTPHASIGIPINDLRAQLAGDE